MLSYVTTIIIIIISNNVIYITITITYIIIIIIITIIIIIIIIIINIIINLLYFIPMFSLYSKCFAGVWCIIVSPPIFSSTARKIVYAQVNKPSS